MADTIMVALPIELTTEQRLQLLRQFLNLYIDFNDIIILDFLLHLLKLFLVAHALVKFHDRNAGQQNIVVTDTLESGDRFGVAVKGVNEDIGITKDHCSEISCAPTLFV